MEECSGVLTRRFATPQHAGKLVEPSTVAIQRANRSVRAPGLFGFDNAQVRLPKDGDERLMRNADNLARLREHAQFFAHAPADLASDIGVNLVKDKRRHSIMTGKHRLDR